MEMIYYIFAALAGLLLLIYMYLTWYYDYWKKLGIPYIEPQLLFGNLKRVFVNQENLVYVYDDFYRKYPDEPAIGAFLLRQPQLIVKDIELVKSVLIKDFNSFHDNDFFYDKNLEPVLHATTLFLSKGDGWKEIRSTQTKHLTSAKLKKMVPMTVDVTKNMIEYVKSNQDVALDAKIFCGHFTLDNIGRCVFGLNTNSYKNPDSEFRQIPSSWFNPGYLDNITSLLSSVLPMLNKLLGRRIFPLFIFDYIGSLIKETLESRIKDDLRHTDYLQSLLDMRKQQKKDLSIEELSGESTIIFVDGYESSSSIMSFILYLLALHPDVQIKLLNELKSVEKFDFETVHSLEYLDCVVNETLRLFPVGSLLHKLCTSDTVLKAGKRSYPIRKGMTVRIPMYSIHRDSKYFTDPDKYDPDRFLEDPNLKNSPAFFPFGQGPRSCIGERFVLTQIKLGIATLLKHFRIIPALPNAKMPKMISIHPTLLFSDEKLMVKLKAW